MVEEVAIIAGTGDLPLKVAGEVREKGHPIVAIAILGMTNPAIERVAQQTFWMKLGHLQKAISLLKSRGVKRLVMAGKIEKSVLMRPWKIGLDRRALRMIWSLKDWRDDTVLKGIAAEFQMDGIVVDEITAWAAKLMAPRGVLTRRKPNQREWKDIEFGRDMAREMGRLDVGQTVIIRNRAVIAVEAIEGTDRAIRRVADLDISDAVVVKMAKPHQDMRFDVPGIGPSTIDSMVAARARVLAVEAGKTMIADYEGAVEQADRAKISIVGILAEGPPEDG
ncbi:MAG: LpxI family protein [Deltaproteobacteria bacterium]|nr:LpxI family protein [Deltaproteobacteria bacterium]